MPCVLNIHRDVIPKEAVFIGRPSAYGIPFSVKQYGRERCIKLYERWVRSQPMLMQQIRSELKGKDLVCYCSPKHCHGEVLLKIANEVSMFD